MDGLRNDPNHKLCYGKRMKNEKFSTMLTALYYVIWGKRVGGEKALKVQNKRFPKQGWHSIQTVLLLQ